MDTLQGTLEEAKRVVGHIAMGDLMGASEAPPGVPDASPFNACRWRDAYPATYRAALEEVLAYVYHHDDLPPDMRTPDAAPVTCRACGRKYSTGDLDIVAGGYCPADDCPDYGAGLVPDGDAGAVVEEEEEEEDAGPCCPVCLGLGVPMGALGRLEWFRCRHCGYEFNRDSPTQRTAGGES
jgi:hypothetical protein